MRITPGSDDGHRLVCNLDNVTLHLLEISINIAKLSGYGINQTASAELVFL